MQPERSANRFTLSEIRSRFAERRARRRLRALALLLASGLVTTQVFPTLAENVTGGAPGNSETSTVTTSPSSDSQTVTSVGEGVELDGTSENQGEVMGEETPTPEPSPTPPPPPPPHATENQEIVITMPSSLRVDPRALGVFLPQSNFYSANTLMVCITSSILRFDVGQAGSVDDSQGEVLMLAGDRTNNLIISGNPSLVGAYINSDKGLRLFRDGGGVSGYAAVFRFIDISEPVIDETLCGDGALANTRYLQVVPLGLTQNITKAKVGLNKGGKKS